MQSLKRSNIYNSFVHISSFHYDPLEQKLFNFQVLIQQVILSKLHGSNKMQIKTKPVKWNAAERSEWMAMT